MKGLLAFGYSLLSPQHMLNLSHIYESNNPKIASRARSRKMKLRAKTAQNYKCTRLSCFARHLTRHKKHMDGGHGEYLLRR